jgi:uncharacterized protein YecT (DUF1311 family)
VSLRGAALGMVLAACAGTASAQVSDKQIQARYTSGYTRCMAAPEGQSTVGMIDCMTAELKLQNQKLNAAYRKALDGLTPDETTRLKAAQRAWIAFRDADCTALDDPQQWGTESRVNAKLCMLDRTIARTIELENFPPN